MAKITTNTKRAPSAILGEIAKITPRDVATPFPPLNLGSEKQCPKTVINATSAFVSKFFERK